MKYWNTRVWATMFVLLGACSPSPSPSGDDPGNQPSAEETNHKADKDFNLIAKVQLPEGNVIGFYEPTPGRVFLSEVYPRTSQPVIQRLGLNHMPPAQAYRTIAPGGAVPEKLAQAEQRARELAAQAAAKGERPKGAPRMVSNLPTATSQAQARPAPAAVAPGVGQTESALSHYDFPYSAPGCVPEFGASNWCNPSTVGGPGYYYYYAEGYDLTGAAAAACAVSGVVNLSVSTDYGISGNWRLLSWDASPCQVIYNTEFEIPGPYGEPWVDYDIHVVAAVWGTSSTFDFAGYLLW